MKRERWGRIVFMSSIAAYEGGINGCRGYARFLLWLWFNGPSARVRGFQGQI